MIQTFLMHQNNLAFIHKAHTNIETLLVNQIYVMRPGSGEDPKLQGTLKNASYQGGRAAN